MRPLPQPPKAEFSAAVARLMVGARTNAALRDYLAEANRAYYHWEKLRYRPVPAEVKTEDGWRLVKWSRMAQLQPIPLQDAGGRPFSYWLPDPVQAVLHEIDRGGGSTLAVEEGAPPYFEAMRGRLIVNSLMEEAIATSQIEGAVTTRKVAKELLRTNRRPRNRSEQMVINSYRTIQLLRERLDEPLSIELIHDIQASMTQGTLDDASASGRFRTAQENVSVVDIRDHEVVFVPPPAGQLIRRLERMLAFVNVPEKHRFVHPLVKAAILHFWLAYEHPYVDGNGRTARALFYWYMLRSGYWLFEFLTISRIILHAPMQYYRSFLYSEQDDNDLTYSLVYFLNATQKAVTALRHYLAEKQDEQQRMAAALRKFPGLNHRQRALIDHALRHPGQVYTFQSHQHSHDISRLTARSDLLKLAELRLLTHTKAGRQHGFLVPENLHERLGGAGKRASREGHP